MSEEKVPVFLLEEAASAVFQEEKVGSTEKVSVVFVPLKLMQELNLRYRGKNSPTDVLAFPLREKAGPARKILGEVVICPEVAKEEAASRGHPVEQELVLLLIHGLLHLLGYEDESESQARLMREKEKKILNTLGRKSDII